MIDPDAEGRRLLDFARASADSPAGFLWLDDDGAPDAGEPVHAWVTTRMTHVFSLAALRGEPGASELAAHGVRALTGPFHDREYGGWHAALSSGGVPVDSTKAAYVHAFVVLAASSGLRAGIRQADALLHDALAVVREAFLDDDGRVFDQLDRDLTLSEDYRGANSSMHMVEACLAAGDVTGDATWHKRALVIAEHLIHDVARGSDYLLPEHFAGDWTPLPDYNAESPADQFRPYGCTPGHLLEWSRLLLQLEASLAEPPGWLCTDASELFSTAIEAGWNVDGRPGFVYTVDWERRPVIRNRMHWVHAEAWAAAAALHGRTSEASYADWAGRFEGFIERHLVDRERGSWHHELDEHNRPSATVWKGKPDVYHAYQALLLSRLPVAPALSVQLAARSRR